MLRVDDLHTYYGNIAALKGVSLEVHDGEIVALIGANGAGKTTMLRTISGLLRPRRGTITLDDTRIDGLPPHRITALGLAHAPEGRRLFGRMTVLENLEMGAFARRDRAAIRADVERVLNLFPRLRERKEQKAGTMSGGEQQMLAIGRALMAQPRLLLLDEPSMGLAPLLVKQVAETVKQLNAEGVTVLLVEQMATMALSVAHRAYVIQNGRVVVEGPSARVAADPEVVRAYLGGAATH
jgi:branched-chain amino acid transport system ATP-binding protein